ncbi:MAG TPA: Gfo/Idh/MocA family oxidoreductase [Roseiflexaceae bacterium]|nr:Gfo/Idh/MocA family oxidoreductase [Roseiflexaceae bacterium]
MFYWGILGAGRIARKFVAAVQQSGSTTALAVASRERARAEAFARETGVPRAYGSYEALLADPEVHGVYVATPNSLHAEWAIAAARAGKHVLCEKPIGATLAEAEAMFAAAREHGVWLMEAFMYRFHPQTLRVQELLGSGAVGQVHMVRTDFGFVLDRPADVRWRADLAGGALMDVGCYCVSFARMVVGEAPARVSAAARWSASGVDQLLAATLEYPGGAVAQIACDYITSFHQTAQVLGSDGVLSLERAFTMPPDQPSSIQLWRGAHFAQQETIVIAPANHYRLEAEGFAALTRAGHGAHGLPEMPLVETLDNMATIEALLMSAREGRPVDVYS